MKLTVSEEVKLHCPSRQDGVVTVTRNLALEAQPAKKGKRVIHGPTGQYWNSNVGLLHDVLDVLTSPNVPAQPPGPTPGGLVLPQTELAAPVGCDGGFGGDRSRARFKISSPFAPR